jgi:hypothetical protein
MYKSLHLNIILVIVFVLAVFSIGYAQWKAVRNSGEIKVQHSPMQSSVTEISKVQKIDISEWKYYGNKRYGFEFKYPNDLEVNDSSNKGISGTDILIYLIAKEKKDNESKLRFLIKQNYSWDGLKAQEVLSEISTNMQALGESHQDILKLQKYNIARSAILTSIGTYQVVVIGDGKKNVVVQSNNYLEDKQTLDQIISTFQFIVREEKK